ncbi:hypothetical protein BO70DRAFT_186305 [Aspergillus heteromorphus CBS 117.55]|uniref:Uncharacterized protein n=1 Tax=Aspergillus heteromorphus CBS 117.55 TaxID=1448321 RepID=A0A317UW36_9EURO|nr:uncharacterized protein BO70DRAFT_186305 [Aspergillus heteromorphus CBS 117.55]PWY65611.1 hypothetical protein BO70DRAFT_186305 [Aspergillus heteromorphus CBS 117.55]
MTKTRSRRPSRIHSLTHNPLRYIRKQNKDLKTIQDKTTYHEDMLLGSLLRHGINTFSSVRFRFSWAITISLSDGVGRINLNYRGYDELCSAHVA